MSIQHTNGPSVDRAVYGKSPAPCRIDGPVKRSARVLQLTTTQAKYMEALFDELSPAERRLLQDLVDGRALPTIAQMRNVTHNTVRTLLARLCAKLDVTHQHQVVSVAMSCGGYKPNLRTLVPHVFDDV